jgi:hypothetical protein
MRQKKRSQEVAQRRLNNKLKKGLKDGTLHHEGKFLVFLKKGQKKFPTHEEKIIKIILGKFF